MKIDEFSTLSVSSACKYTNSFPYISYKFRIRLVVFCIFIVLNTVYDN
jgi:hypothetical protein